MKDIANHASLTTDLVAYWQLGEPSGTRYDKSGNGHNLTDYNTVTGADGVDGYGKGSDFELANTEYLGVSNPYTYTNADFTVAMWVKPESISATWQQLYYHWGTLSGTQAIINDTKLTIYVHNGSTHSNWQGTISGGFSAGN